MADYQFLNQMNTGKISHPFPFSSVFLYMVIIIFFYRPFARRLPEFKFWHSSVRSVFIAIFLTFFDAVNVPVFWPILLLYFIILFVITMKRQIKHMIKYRYVPFSFGKQTYGGKGGKDSK
jgi:hypothetical protein